MNKLNKLYKAILESLGCSIKENYQIVMINNGKEYEVKVDNKKTYLPTNEALNTLDRERVFFHPACESITSKETEIDKVLRKLITSSIYFNFKPIAAVLIKVANKKSNKTISGKMLERLEILKGISKDLEREIIDLIARISMQTEYEGIDTRIINYTLMRGGKTEMDEHIYYRCIPSFPFYNEITRTINQNSGMNENQTIIFNDSNYKLKTLKIVQSIFELAIPYVEDPSRGEAISLQPTAARMIAMLRCFGHIAGEINNLVAKFRKEFDSIGMYGIETSWIEQLDDLPELVGLVPPLDYNNYNTAGKPQDPEQDLSYDLFNVLSNQQPVNNVPNVQQYQTQQTTTVANNNQVVSPTIPPKREGETYIGMTSLPNGLYEFRFQNGNVIRVVCANDKGQVYTENFTYSNGQPYTGYQQPQPIISNALPLALPQSGVINMPGYSILPNGVVVPHTSQPNPYQQNATSGMTAIDTAFNTSPSTGMMTGVQGNWS